MTDLPKGVGPHEDKELELMLAGRKPLAMFYDTIPECGVIPEDDFRPYVDKGLLIKSELFRDAVDYQMRYIFYALPEEKPLLDKIAALLQSAWSGQCPMDDAYEYKVGSLLGYEEWEISAFIEWQNGKGMLNA